MDGGRFLIVYSGNSAGEMYLGEITTLVDQHSPTRLLATIPTVPVQVVGGFQYSEDPVPYTVGNAGMTVAKHAWSYYYSVAWQPQSGSDTYSVYTDSGPGMSSKQLLADSVSGNVVAINMQNTRLPLTRPYVGVFTAAGVLVGATEFSDVSNFPKLPRVSNVQVANTDQRTGWLGGIVKWSEPTLNNHLVEKYSIRSL